MRLEDVKLAQVLAMKFDPLPEDQRHGFAGAEGDLFVTGDNEFENYKEEFFALMDVTPDKIVIQIMDEDGRFRMWEINPEAVC